MAADLKPLLAANWKMNPLDGGAALDLVKGVLPVASAHVDRVEIALFPPFPWLLGVAEVVVKAAGARVGTLQDGVELDEAFLFLFESANGGEAFLQPAGVIEWEVDCVQVGAISCSLPSA